MHWTTLVLCLLTQSTPDKEVLLYFGEHEWSCIDACDKVLVDEGNPKKPPAVVTLVSRRQLCLQHSTSNWANGTAWLFVDEYIRGFEGAADDPQRHPVAWKGRYTMSAGRDNVGDLSVGLDINFHSKFVGTPKGSRRWRWEFEPDLKDQKLCLVIPLGDAQFPIDAADMLVVRERRSWTRKEEVPEPVDHFCNVGDTLRMKRGSMLRGFIGQTKPPGFHWNDKETMMSKSDVEALLHEALED